MAERAPWIKLWCDYTSTPSHDELDAHAMWVGVVLMLLVRAGNGASSEETTWALQQSGAPYTVAGIAKRARLTTRQVEVALAALVGAGTVAKREDGAWGLPKFWTFQRSSAAERMARMRDKGRHSAPGVTPENVTLDVKIASLTRSLRSEEPPVAPKGAKRGSAPRPKPADPLDEPAARVLTKLNELRSEGVPGSKLSDTRWILTLLRARPDAETETATVLESMAAEARASGDWQHVNTATPFRLAHFEARLARAQATVYRRPPTSRPQVSSLPSAAEIRDREAAEDAERGWS